MTATIYGRWVTNSPVSSLKGVEHGVR